MKKFFFVCLFFMTFLLAGEKLGVLNDVMQAQSLEVEGNRLYVTDGTSIYIYSTKDLKLIGKFGQKGEGPGEMRTGGFISIGLSVYPDYLLVTDRMGQGMPAINKMIYYTRDGKYIKENKNWQQVFRVHPIGKNFVANKISRDQKGNDTSVVAIYGPDLKLKKELCRQSVSENPKKFFIIPDTIQFAVYKNRIYLENSTKGFVVEVFDSEGNLVSTIKKNIKPIKLTDALKERFMDEFKQDRLNKYNASHLGGMNAYLKNFTLLWPDELPLIRTIIVSGDKIYLKTYNEKENKTEYVIMDINGNNQKSVFLPKAMLTPIAGRVIGYGIRLFDIDNDKFYYILENEDEEEWEVHVEKIE